MGGVTAQPVDMIIKNAMILPMTVGEPLITDGAIAVKDGRIQDIGETERILRLYTSHKEIDGARKVVLPGFVNTHFHFTQNFLKGSKDDLDLLDWIDQVSFPRIKEVVRQFRSGQTGYHYHSVMHGGIDLLSSGITTTVNMEWAMSPDIIGAYEELGMRVINVLTLTDVDTWTPCDAILTHDEYFSLGRELIERCRKSQEKRVSFAYGVACPNSNTRELIHKARQAAYEDGVNLHIHLAETKYEFDTIRGKTGLTPVEYLEELGFWDSDVWAAHSIWLTSDDQRILRSHNVGVAHNPKCNMKIADGAAPIAEMLSRGIPVGLGIDSCAVSDNTDFFEAMRTSVFLQRVHNLNSRIMTGKDALVMATRKGAEAIKMSDEIGTLEIGKQADMILVSLEGRRLRPFNDLINNLVFAANSSDIHTVIVAGDILIDGGKFTRFDADLRFDQAEEYVAELLWERGLNIPDYFAVHHRRGEI